MKTRYKPWLWGACLMVTAAMADTTPPSGGQCKKTGEDFVVKTTGEHHCAVNCKGEPTRTNYTLELPSLEEGSRYVNPVLVCVAGPCGAWNQVIANQVTQGGKRVKASFDVWSHPTTWKLSADIEKCG